ncbi:MAG TPA: hypothetical protein VN698_12140 [Bacteroidia bacterium]|nr:hypothetical protein [Bacteroidia bacterium]
MKKLLLVYFGLIGCLTVGQANNLKGNEPLLELQSFSAVCIGEKIEMEWKASAKTSNVCFTIEKSKDGKNFTKVIDVPCAGESYRDYAEVDYKPYKGTSYYRLKQTDKSGACKYSAMVAVNSVLVQKRIRSYPDLLRNGVDSNIVINKDDSEEVVVVLRDKQGRELVSKVLLMVEKNVVFIVDEKKLVPPGSYVITASSNHKICNYKLVVK